jgi:glycine oxidase
LLGRVAAGAEELPGLVVATGFFRHGVLLTPVAARICADLIDGVQISAELLQFHPDRFSNMTKESHA